MEALKNTLINQRKNHEDLSLQLSLSLFFDGGLISEKDFLFLMDWYKIEPQFNRLELGRVKTWK